MTASYAELLAPRYSCRGFLPDPVPRHTIERILSLARRTASCCSAITQAALEKSTIWVEGD